MNAVRGDLLNLGKTLEIPTNLGKIVGINKDGQCRDVGIRNFLNLFPRLRDTYEAILLNSRIPEPANIEFYGKYLSGEDFCYFLRFDDIMAGPREGE